MIIVAEPIDAEAFAPFGDLLAAPRVPGRHAFGSGLANLRGAARSELTLSHVAPQGAFPLTVREMERHAYSSQSFLPLSVARWLVIVALSGADGAPDGRRARAFLAGAQQGVTYRVGTWHHPLTVLDEPAQFAGFMWRDGSTGDEEFMTLSAPFAVALPKTPRGLT
jgi:ureidoglycolate lyase